MEDSDLAAVRFGGIAAILSGVTFLVTIAYTFGYLFSLGLSTDMLNNPAQLLPWIHAHTVPYVGLWWIFVLHLLFLIPAPAALAAITGRERPAIRASSVAGVAGAVVGMAASMIIAATAPWLGAAAADAAPSALPQIYTMSVLAGALGLELRLLSALLISVWLFTAGLTLIRLEGWRALATAMFAASALALVVIAAKPFDWLDLEPSLGFVLALVYLWIGVALVRHHRLAPERLLQVEELAAELHG